jgi:hypothetical protein
VAQRASSTAVLAVAVLALVNTAEIADPSATDSPGRTEGGVYSSAWMERERRRRRRRRRHRRHRQHR